MCARIFNLVVKGFFKSLELILLFKIASNCKNDSIWVLLSLAIKHDHKIHKINAKNKLLMILYNKIFTCDKLNFLFKLEKKTQFTNYKIIWTIKTQYVKIDTYIIKIGFECNI
jgi:hypothetical protein